MTSDGGQLSKKGHDDEGEQRARATVTVAAWTTVSRVSGLARVIAVGAVLGPTALGNSFMLTNTLPNLVYYGFLGGSLVSTILVPVLVGRLMRRGAEDAAALGSAFLGVAVLVAVVVVPVAALLLPALLALTVSDGDLAATQLSLVRALVWMTAPQVVLYAVAGTAAAALTACRRFALPAAGAALENVGVIAALVCFAFLPGSSGGDVGIARLAVLGLGATAAVGLNAGLQWWGAKRAGILLRPRAGWRDPEVRAVLARTLRAVAQAALLAVQLLSVLLLSSRVPGGTVALQVAFNFVALPVALLATPVGLAMLPDVSAAVATDRVRDAAAVARQGLALTAFLTLPAAVGLVLLAEPLADVVARGAMASGHGRELTAGALAFMGPGLVGQSLFFVATQVSYARGGARGPLLCMATQAGLCLGAVAVVASTVRGSNIVELAAAGWSLASVVGGAALTLLVLGGDAARLGRTAWRTAVACLLLWWPVTWTVSVAQAVAGAYGSVVALIAGALVGICVYVGVQSLLRAPELAWLWRAMRPRRASSGHLVAP